eukprot:5009725-Pleurochrysis_carterae.AAC.1
MQTFTCDSFVYDDDTGEVREYMHEDYTVECDGSEYQKASALAIAAIVLWPIGVPLTELLLAAVARRASTLHTPSDLATSSSFVWQDYTKDAFYWEVSSSILASQHQPDN